jgi:hypothetical protein
MKHGGSSPHSQKPATCPYPEPHRFGPCILILSSHICLSLPSDLLPSRFPTKNPVCISSPYVLQVLPISVLFNWSSEWYLVRSTEHKALCYVVFSTPLLPHPSWAQISSSAPYSRKPSLSLHSSLDVSVEVSQPYKTTDKIIVFFIFKFTFLGAPLNRRIIWCQFYNSLLTCKAL